LKIALLSNDKDLKESLHDSMKFERFSHNPTSLEKDMMVILDDNYGELEEVLKSVPSEKLFYLSHQDDEKNIHTIHDYKLNHLISYDLHGTPIEIISNYKKLNAPKHLWGSKHYLREGTITDKISISESKREMHKIEEILKLQNWEDFFDSPVGYINTMANELISNALYNGPEEKRESGNYPVDRKSPVHLKGSELVQLEIGIDETVLALSVIDCFGSLTKDKVIKSLYRSFNEKTVEHKKGGAGLGLYLAYSYGHQFIVNRRAGFRTEVICIIEKTKRYKNYRSRKKSFHFFEEASGHE
jgi:phosphoserine phosphatase RsbU/P